MKSQSSLPNQAEIIVIGGGVIGVSVAYHLALAGKRDVLLLEKAELTHGCTWHAAGLVGQLRGKLGLTRLMQYSTELFSRLENETGLSPGWNSVGSLRIASTKERWTEIQHTALKARSFNIELHLLDTRETVNLFPLIDPGKIFGAAYLPDDGYVDPYGVTQSMAKGFRALGGTISEHTLVTNFERSGNRITAVHTDQQSIKCETVVNCAGLWARRVGSLAGISIPAGIVEHQYLITEKSKKITDHLPTLRDPDRNFYLKAEAGAFEFGGWEDDSLSIPSQDFPYDFTRTLYESNYDRFSQIHSSTTERIPLVENIGIHSLINGPIPVSADGEPIMGCAPGLENFYVTCGFTAGIASSGGAGRAMAEWIVEGQPSLDLWSFDLRRFGDFHAQSPYLEKRALHSYGRYYKIHWPFEEPLAGQKLRCSPLYDELKQQGAVYGSKFGWERPNWFAGSESEPRDIPTFERPNWFERVSEECQAIRSNVAVIDQTSFFKFEISGRDSLATLELLCSCNVDRPIGSVIYAQMCNESGGIECDVVIFRLDAERFWLFSGSGFGVHDLDWVEKHTPKNHETNIRNITEDYAVLNLCGPHSRSVLERVVKCDTTSEAFPYMTCRISSIDNVEVCLARLEYSGELGWEISVRNHDALKVYRKLFKVGLEFGIINAGYRALESLRLENRNLYWSGEISPYINPYEVGLNFRISKSKQNFIGKSALDKIKLQGPKRTLYCFHCPEFVPIYGGEPIVLDDKIVTHTLSGGYGHTVQKTICYAFLDKSYEARDGFHLQTINEQVPVEKQKGPLYRRSIT